jgi:phosphohistidine swiveling domain-containing protein
MKLSIQPLDTCLDPAIVGEKAAGLARLLQAGFRVPRGFCVTTQAYREVCARVGLHPQREWDNLQSLPAAQRTAALSAVKASLATFSWPAQWSADLDEAILKVQPGSVRFWAIRSSATNEDTADASAAGLYRTELAVRNVDMREAIRRCWASLWEECIFGYYAAKGTTAPTPAMAVIVQPMIEARASGVAFSRHPITRRADEVLVNAVPGLAEPLVSGRVAPDEYVVTQDSSGRLGRLTHRYVAHKPYIVKLTKDGLVIDQIPGQEKPRSSLTDDEAVRLAASVQEIEQVWGMPVDVEWAFDDEHLWLLQARPFSTRTSGQRLTNQQCDWSRANFKETLPELPSPLGLSFLEVFMEDFIIRHYRELGCVIPEGVSPVRIIEGRPFINVTLLQSFLAQLGGHPERVTEQMGGESRIPLMKPGRLPAWKLVRGYLLMHCRIRRALRRAPAWFEELKRTACNQTKEPLSASSPQEVIRRMEWLGNRLSRGECTFAIVAAVGQAQQMLGLLLPRWLGPDWRVLLNAALQGQETIISAKQIRWLRQIGERARSDAKAAAFFLSESWEPASYRDRLTGTSCLVELDAFLQEYGHRAIGESDLMAPRFAEDPTYLLTVIRRHVAHVSGESAEQAALRQRQDRAAALARIRERCGWRYDRWLVFRWWYRRLCRAYELREANRHHLMYHAAATRHHARALGRRLSGEGRLSDPDDVFFVTADELKRLTCEPPDRDWKALVATRRASRQIHSKSKVPDFISTTDNRHMRTPESMNADGVLRGVPIGVGIVEGRVAVVQSMEDVGKVRHGDIIVTEVIDPGTATLFGLAGGVIADMGGTLSHGAIIVREYGIPAIVNVGRATRTLKDGEWVKLNATEGFVHRCSA